MHDVIDNRGSRRFELLEQGQIAYADYEIDGDRLILPHVEAPIGLRGTGAAGRLMEGVLSIARERGQRQACKDEADRRDEDDHQDQHAAHLELVVGLLHGRA